MSACGWCWQHWQLAGGWVIRGAKCVLRQRGGIEKLLTSMRAGSIWHNTQNRQFLSAP